MTPAVIDKETGDIETPAVYNTVPTSEEELSTEAFKHFPSCTKPAFDYTIEIMVKNMTIEGTRAAYSDYFKNLPSI